MGVYERDWMRRGPTASVRSFPTRRRWSLPAWAIWLVIALVVFALARWLVEVRRSVPFPSTGAVQWYVDTTNRPTARLTVQTPPSSPLNFVVRLDQWEGSAPVAMIPVRGGESASVAVPLGRYRVTVIKGKGWQGPERLFGMLTNAQEGVHPLEFYRTGNTVMGHTLHVERLNGNMETRRARL
jgi:hypothetical protein